MSRIDEVWILEMVTYGGKGNENIKTYLEVHEKEVKMTILWKFFFRKFIIMEIYSSKYHCFLFIKKNRKMVNQSLYRKEY